MVMIGDPRETTRISDPVISQVVGDNYGTMYKATSFLIKRKFRRIALISPPESLIWGKAFLNGYREALQDNDIEFKQEYCYSLNDHRDCPEDVVMNEKQVLRKIFSLDKLPEILIINVECYEIAKKIASKYKIRIPEDISIITTASSRRPVHGIPCLFSEARQAVLEAFDLLNIMVMLNKEELLEPLLLITKV
jgi:DNA-binding LacI/PurR family transcriptional regulator